jgi:hypothetical protein
MALTLAPPCGLIAGLPSRVHTRVAARKPTVAAARPATRPTLLRSGSWLRRTAAVQAPRARATFGPRRALVRTCLKPYRWALQAWTERDAVAAPVVLACRHTAN